MSGRRVTTYSHRRSRARGGEASPAGLTSAQQHDARDAGASLNGRSSAGKRARQSALSRTNSTDPNRSIKRPRKIDSEANAMSLDTPFGMTSATYDYETPANAMDSSITMTSGGGPKVLPPRTDRMSPVRAPSGSRTASRGLKENTGTSRSASRSGKATAPGQTRVKLGLASPFHSQPGSAPESPKKTTQMSAKKARTLSNASEDLEVASVHVSHRRRLSGPSTSLFVNVPDEHWLRPARVLGSSPFTVDYVPSETPVPFDLPDWSIDSATFAEPGPLRMSTPPLRRRVPQEGALSAPNSPSDEEDADMSDDNAKTPGISLRRSRTKSYSADSILDYDSIMDSTLEVTAAKSASRRSVVRRGDGRSSLEIGAPREIDTDVNRPTTAPSSPDNSRILPDELTSMFNDLGIADRSSQPSRTRSLDASAEYANTSRPRARTIRASDYPQRAPSLGAAVEISATSGSAVPLSKTTRTRSGTIRPAPGVHPDPPISLPNLPPAAVLKPSKSHSHRPAMDARESPPERSMASSTAGSQQVVQLLVPPRRTIRRPMPSSVRARVREIEQEDLGAYDANSDSLAIDQRGWNWDGSW